MIDPVAAGHDWGLRYTNIFRDDEGIAEDALAEFWPRAKYAIDRPIWPGRRGLRIAWWVSLAVSAGLTAYVGWLVSIQADGGAIGDAATRDLSVANGLLAFVVLGLLILTAVRVGGYLFVGVPLANQHRQEWCAVAGGAALSAIDQQRRASWPATRPQGPRPQPFGISSAAAPELVREWLQHLGEADAVVLDRTSTGIDIGSTKYVAKVWLQDGPVTAADLKDLAAAAFMHKRAPAAFTTGEYAPEARLLAEGRIALFRFSPEDGTLSALNSMAEGMRAG